MALNNMVQLEGRLTAKPELRKTKNDVSVTSFTVAVNRPYRRDKETQADFPQCQAYRGTAEFICRNFDKGDAIKLTGFIATGSYEKDGQRRFTTNVAVEDVGFVTGNNRNQTQSEPQQQTQAQTQPTGNPAPSYAQPDVQDFEEIIDDDDLPF